jgi:glycosyltransferase involved in cell wall biosynthesis
MELFQDFQDKSLMIFDDQVYYFNGLAYSCDDSHVLFMIGMKRYFQRLVLCSRLAPSAKSASYTVPQDIEICPLPYYKNLAELCVKAAIYLPKIWRVLQTNFEKWDMLWLFWPHPISLLILMLIRLRHRQKIPILIIRNNLHEAVRFRYHGLQKVAAVGIVNLLDWQLKLWRHHFVIFAVGDEMYQKFRRSYPHVYQMVHPLISKNDILDFHSLNSRLHKPPSRLLFVGRLDPEKGLPFLIRCVAMLKEQSKKIHLDIVGSGSEENTLQALVQSLDVNEEVSFHGYIAFSEALFSYYRAADIFVLPSLPGEGVPKVLMEAMAFGVPIIATQVGGIAGLIRHKENGLLVKPGSARVLAEAITELMNNPNLVDDLRQRATADSAAYTMEAQQEKMLEALAAYSDYGNDSGVVRTSTFEGP